MSSVSGVGMSMSSLYAMLGRAMPSGAVAAAGDAGSTPAIAMIAATNATVAQQVSTLLGSMVPAQLPSGGSSLSAALANLENLDPSVELQRLANAVGDAAAG